MNQRKDALVDLLEKIADEINITETMQNKAIQSYEAVGVWLGKGIDYEVKIMPQGSMNLGTVIKPIDDSDDYDIDLVCLLKDGGELPLSKIKGIVGDRLKENKKYITMLEKEGKRCWTMHYDEFHMDILPCVPYRGNDIENNGSDIKLTHKNSLGYYEARYSNPEGYQKWFENSMEEPLLKVKSQYAQNKDIEIEKVPTYSVRTTLQKSVQLLKRHRDIFFRNNENLKVISIIITTLAAKAYKGEDNLYDALENILEGMPNYIKKVNGKLWIENPVRGGENFADKWNDEINKYKAFKEWVEAAKEDLLILRNKTNKVLNNVEIGKHFKEKLGKEPVERAYKVIASGVRDSREKGNLFLVGLDEGIKKDSNNGKQIKDHRFYGK